MKVDLKHKTVSSSLLFQTMSICVTLRHKTKTWFTHQGLQMQNIFKLFVVHIHLHQISCYCWTHTLFVTQYFRNKTNLKHYVAKSLQPSDGVSMQVSEICHRLG